MKRGRDFYKNLIWTTRIYAIIIILAILISDFNWISDNVFKLIVMLMAIFVLIETFKPYLYKNQKIMKWAIIICAVLFLLGMIVFLLVK